MPWMIKKNGDKFCVHKQNEDKTPGAKLKCYPSENEAKQYLKALYANAGDENMTDSKNNLDFAEGYSIKPEGEKFCVYEGEKKIKTFDSEAEAQAFIDDMDKDEDTEEQSVRSFLFTELSDVADDVIVPMDGLAAGTFTSNSGRQVTFDPKDLPEYVANTKAIIESTRTGKGEVVGLPIDEDAHDHKGGAGWIVDADLDKARNVVRFMVKWTKQGTKIIKDNTRRFFSPTTDVTNKAVLGGSLTNWPASRSQAGHMMLRPVELSNDLKQIDTEVLVERLLELPLAMAKGQTQSQSQELSKSPEGEKQMSETINPNIADLLKTPEAIAELGRQANDKAQELVMADRRKREVVEFASTLVGGTKEKPFGLPVRADDVVQVLLSLPLPQAKAVEKLLTMALNAAIDFAEHGYAYAADGALMNSGKPRLDDTMKSYLSQWLSSGQTVAGFFEQNPELGSMNDYNLAEFVEKAKV